VLLPRLVLLALLLPRLVLLALLLLLLLLLLSLPHHPSLSLSPKRVS
jgi:hypothetical protein